jgi:hypothetical protein
MTMSQSVYKFNRVANQAREAWGGGAYIALKGNLSVGGVRDPDMSGFRHVQPISLEPGLGTEYVRFRHLVTEESG